MKRWIESNFPEETDAEAVTKKELFRVTAEHKLIQKNFNGFDDKIMSMYSLGMTTQGYTKPEIFTGLKYLRTSSGKSSAPRTQ